MSYHEIYAEGRASPREPVGARDVARQRHAGRSRPGNRRDPSRAPFDRGECLMRAVSASRASRASRARGDGAAPGRILAGEHGHGREHGRGLRCVRGVSLRRAGAARVRGESRRWWLLHRAHNLGRRPDAGSDPGPVSLHELWQRAVDRHGELRARGRAGSAAVDTRRSISRLAPGRSPASCAQHSARRYGRFHARDKT